MASVNQEILTKRNSDSDGDSDNSLEILRKLRGSCASGPFRLQFSVSDPAPVV